MTTSPYLNLPTRALVDIVRDRHIEREAAGDRSREHVERALLLDEIDRLEAELARQPSVLHQAAPALALAVCAGAWGATAAWWLR